MFIFFNLSYNQVSLVGINNMLQIERDLPLTRQENCWKTFRFNMKRRSWEKPFAWFALQLFCHAHAHAHAHSRREMEWNDVLLLRKPQSVKQTLFIERFSGITVLHRAKQGEQRPHRNRTFIRNDGEPSSEWLDTKKVCHLYSAEHFNNERSPRVQARHKPCTDQA